MPETRDSTQPTKSAALARWILVIGATFAALALAFLWIARSLTSESADGGARAQAPPVEYPVPDFRLASLDGGTLGPPDFEGKAVIIDFWATWCGPCKIQAKMLEKMHEEVDGQHVQFLAINLGEDLETVKRYVEATPFSYSVLLDPQEELSARYQIYGLPTLMVVDREGRVSYMRTGLTDIPTLRKALAKAGVDV